jgi:hypothetical protein
MEKIEACWNISLDCECPNCEESIDLTDGDDFWYGIQAGEHETRATKDFEVCCPKCDHEFKVDFIY